MNKDNKQTAPAHVEAEKEAEKVVPGTTIPEQTEKAQILTLLTRTTKHRPHRPTK